MGRLGKSAKIQKPSLSKERFEKKLAVEESLRGNDDKLKPSSHLTIKQKKIFYKIVRELENSKILGNLDIYVLDHAAIAIDRLQTIEQMINQEDIFLTDKTLMSTKEKYTKDFFKCCQELCLSPSSRAKVGYNNLISSEAETDPLLKILKGGKNAN